jgi:hypothetical protein
MGYIQSICFGTLKKYLCTIRNVFLDHRLSNNSTPVPLSIAFLMPEGWGEEAKGSGGEVEKKLTYI